MKPIELKEKFTSVHFEDIISRYWQMSFEEKMITFDMTKLEWIAIEQLTFLISWINALVDLNKSVTVNFPSIYGIQTDSQEFIKRQKCINYLLSDWNLLELLDKRVKTVKGYILPTKKTISKIPYHKQELIPYKAKTFDNDFFELYETSFIRFVKYVESEIKEYTLLDYFDNHFLHYSIIKEFYSNTCQHAFDDTYQKSCYFSLKSNNKISRYYGDLLKEKLEERYSERPIEEQEYFKNSKGEFINTSFIEMNFLDFGIGIVNTLREKYLSEDTEFLKKKLSSNHFDQNDDTRVLEYAFLLFTSKYELGKDLSMHDYIPRGLYIIKNIIKQYKGMIIARSKRGKVIYNFNTSDSENEIIFREKDNDIEEIEGFPGTSITLILPSKQVEKKVSIEEKIEEIEATPPKPHVINLLKYSNKILSSKFVANEKNEIQKRIKFLEEFFRTISSDFLNYDNPNGDLTLIDFAGIERATIDIYSKLIYFLAYCPLISDKVNICLFNLMEKGIHKSLIEDEELIKKSKGFFIKPIPCIYPDLTIDWIGINDEELDYRLNEVWKGNIIKNETFLDIHHLSSNVLKIMFEKDGKTTFLIQIQSYQQILRLLYEHHKDFINNELTKNTVQFETLIDENHNYNIVLNKKYLIDKDGNKLQRAYLTSNGKYQIEFLTFIEKLYIREYRRLISIYFLFNLCYEKTNAGQKKDLEEITKVLTVTLSSQLLGKEFTEIINELNVTNKEVFQIPLSNYYDFHSEESFNNIQEKDNIIVVNDVISTGNLSSKIIKSVEERDAKITSILTIIDSRTNNDRKIQINSDLTILNAKPIEKFDENPFSTNPVWINPILNAPTTMSKEKSNKESILKSPHEFLNFFEDDSFFKVGYFQQNSRYLTYYLQTDDFLKNELKNGFPILTQIIDALKRKVIQEKNLSIENDIVELRKIRSNFDSQYYESTEISSKSDSRHKSILKHFKIIEEQLKSQLTHRMQYSFDEKETTQFVDFIFYPFLSSVSEIEKNLNPILHKLSTKHSVEVYPLPRIMTPRGWRFSFPPKFLNSLTKDKSILILDDGSCTGETVIQMIDSLSFLEIKEILVLSIFGRLEDFQREFLSRIKLVKVKDQAKSYKSIPVSVFFGTHFHIPIYNKNNHPLKIEIKELDDIESIYYQQNRELPSHLREYIEKRRGEIIKPVNPRLSDTQFTLIPSEVPKKLMFQVRDLIGNFDSYRLFKEDEIVNDNSQKDGQILHNLKDILTNDGGKIALTAVLIKEPFLVETIHKIYPEILFDKKEPNNLSDFIHNEIEKKHSKLDIEYLRFCLVGLYTINHEEFLNYDFLLKVLEYIESIDSKGKHVSNYVGYIFSTILYKTKSIFTDEAYFTAKLIIQKLYLHINDLGTHEKKYASLLKELYNESLIVLDDFPGNKEVKLIFRLKQYYQRQVSNHDGTKRVSHPNYYTGYSSITNRLGVFTENPPSDSDKTKLYKDLEEIVETTNTRLIKDLKSILTFLEPFYLNFDFKINVSEYSQQVKEFERLKKSLENETKFKEELLSKDNIPVLLKWLEKFNENFFYLKSPLPDFFIKNKSNLSHIIKNTLNEHEILYGKSKIKNEVPSNINLSIHPYLLRLIFFELIENKYKYAERVKAIFKYSEEERHIAIIYTQTQSFNEDRNENGLITIRNIISRYGGRTYIKIKPNYELTIKLSKEILL